MKVPVSWLREFIPDLPAVADLRRILDGLGLAVEGVERYAGAPAGPVVVRLEDVTPMEGSDHLLAARAFDGERHWDVLTGAPNAAAGMMTAFAPPGTNLPGLPAPVGSRNMAGRVSDGMLLSPRELGVFDHAAGLIELPADLTPGAGMADLWPADDVIELELTANRADAFSILGVARDVAAKLGVPLRLPFEIDQDTAAGGRSAGPAAAGLTVVIDDPAGCPLFTLQRIDGVTIGPSPLWLQRRLAAIGLRPRNNVVDVTNFVTFELGQPSHAYDLRALPEGVIGVRRATDGEALETLGGDSLELTDADLVITGGPGKGEAIGLAGVIGGAHDSVRNDTATVALEVAHFDPRSIRGSSRRHGQHTDAHYRFERGVDPNLPWLASARAAGLIATVAGGEVAPELASVGGPPARRFIDFVPSRVEFLTTLAVPRDEQERFLTALGFGIERRGDDDWRVEAPSWRFDMTCAEDLIEEVARMYGYEHIGESVPHMRFTPPLTDPTHRRLRARLADAGFQELMSYIWMGEDYLARTSAPPPVVRLAEPQGVERAVLRTALWPSLLSAAVVNRAQPSLAFFEIGSVFLEEEQERLGLLLRGPWVEASWRQAAQPGSAFVLKGQLERLAASLGVRVELRNEPLPQLHPGVSATVWWNGVRSGFLGQIHPGIAADLELPDTFVAELDLPLETGAVGFTEPSRQERAERDLALVTPDIVSMAELREILAPAAGPLLESLVPFDVYVGERIGAGWRSIALRFTFRSAERALTDEEVTQHMSNVMQVAKNAGYDVRDR